MRGNWRVDCPKMQLRSRGKPPKYLYSGPGYIFQPARGTFAFHLYSHRKQNSITSGLLDLLKTGEIIPDDVYFDLSAEDQHGRLWRSRRILPNSLDRAASGNLIIDGELSELSIRFGLPRHLDCKGSHIKLYTFHILKIPLIHRTIRRTKIAKGFNQSSSRNAWIFRCLGISWQIVQEAEQASIEAYSESDHFPPHIEDRIIDALEFVSGHAVQCEVLRIRRNHSVEITLRQKLPLAAVTRWQRPLAQQFLTIPGTRRVTIRYHKRLFERFLRHGLACTAAVHPISAQLAAVREAGAGRYIDAYALTLCVAMESLLQSSFGKVRIKIPTEQELGDLLKWIQDWKGSAQLKNRTAGAIGQMRQRRAGDIMRALVGREIITRDQYKAWDRLRNRSAHEYQLSKNNPEELRTLLPKVEVLLNHLIFHAIGYKGPYTDYASLDWPIRQYPNTVQKINAGRQLGMNGN